MSASFSEICGFTPVTDVTGMKSNFGDSVPL
jgi:hypothetical protein